MSEKRPEQTLGGIPVITSEAVPEGEAFLWNPALIDAGLFDRIVKNAKSKRSHGGGKWRKAKGRIMLWRGLFFFTPDEGQSPQ